MERLTERHENGTAMIKGCGANCKYGFAHCRKEDWENCKTIEDVIDKLADYEDAEENGLLLRLPCNVEDTVYCIRTIGDGKDTKEILDFKVVRFDIGKHFLMVNKYTHTLNVADIGKTVFLTREEAEKALAGMGV